MTRAVLSIGSNVGDRLAHLQSAVDAVRPWLVATSPVYETDPWGDVAQDDFLNAVVIADDPSADGDEWLARAHAVEDANARERSVRWGPRTLDVDVIDVDGTSRADPRLTLPHPRAAERAFVLIPWLTADAAASLDGRAVAEYLTALSSDDVAGVRLRTDLVLR